MTFVTHNAPMLSGRQIQSYATDRYDLFDNAAPDEVPLVALDWNGAGGIHLTGLLVDDAKTVVRLLELAIRDAEEAVK